jgi:predicted DNA-binding transcriptional regulator AlpA
MSLREAEQQPHRISERDRALDDMRVMTLRQWCEVNGFSWWTGQRLIKAGHGPKILQLSPRRVGITVRANREWQQARERA